MLCLVSAGFSFFEKWEIGHHWPSMRCWRTAQTNVSEASVIMLIAASGCRWTKRVVLVRASLIEEKAVVASSVHEMVLFLSFAPASKSLRSWRIAAQCGRNRW